MKFAFQFLQTTLSEFLLYIVSKQCKPTDLQKGPDQCIRCKLCISSPKVKLSTQTSPTDYYKVKKLDVPAWKDNCGVGLGE